MDSYPGFTQFSTVLDSRAENELSRRYLKIICRWMA